MFKNAQPVWVAGMEEEMNCELSLRVSLRNLTRAVIDLATSAEYQLFVNGIFVAFGPAKAAKGFFKVDTIDLTPYLSGKADVIVINVLSARINSFSLMDQPPFVAAEIYEGGKSLVWTGENGGIPAYRRQCRVQKVQRYGYQRTFTEVYRLKPEDFLFYTEPECTEMPVRLTGTEQKKWFPRDVRYPQYVQSRAVPLSGGSVNFEAGCKDPFRDRSYVDIGPKIRGFAVDELEEHLSDEVQGFAYQEEAVSGEFPEKLKDAWLLCEYPIDMSGFITLDVRCEEACVVYVLFDEILVDGKLDFLRLWSCNCVKFYLEPGTYHLQSFQPYTMKYAKVIVRGSAEVTGVGMVQFKHAEPNRHICLPQQQSDLFKIAQAALETYQQNAIDFFYDCPSRERAGWLCDSFFTARVEKVLTGESILERAMLRNFILPETFDYLPEGMLPMCYPADHDEGTFIPNWAMWFVLELEEYLDRSGDRELIRQAEPKVLGLVTYFQKFENQDGLLEKLDGWVFVEWSAAAEWVQDISFPSNMLYARMLKAVARMYDRTDLAKKSERLMETIRKRSYNGSFFTDHEVLEDGVYKNPGHRSEVCQYYAFFTGVADKKDYPELWKTMVDSFGPERPEDVFPDVAPANAFIGDYLRLELLYLDGQYEKLLEDVRGYFLPMAERTGTLWEKTYPIVSCCHGFASHVLYWLAQIYGTTEKA